MENKKIFALFISLLIIYASMEMPFIANAQQPTIASDDIPSDVPSDLSLDLVLAKQSPAPDQKAIVASETQQATVVATTGETIIIVPQDVVSPQAKTEPEVNALNPDQTTSEQIITRPVTVQIEQNATPTPENQPSPTSGDVNNVSPASQNNNINGPDTNNLVPGTSVVAPDDNSAPADNSGNPNLPAPTPTVDNGTLNTNPSNQVNPTSAPDNSGSSAPPSNPSSTNSNQQSIPSESQPASPPNDQGSPPSGDSGSSDTTVPNESNPTVQGTSTGPETNVFQRAITNIFNFLTGK